MCGAATDKSRSVRRTTGRVARVSSAVVTTKGWGMARQAPTQIELAIGPMTISGRSYAPAAVEILRDTFDGAETVSPWADRPVPFEIDDVTEPGVPFDDLVRA